MRPGTAHRLSSPPPAYPCLPLHPCHVRLAEQLLSHEFIVFLEHVKHLHLFVHCWFAVAGYVGPGGWCSPWGKSLPQILSDTDAANTVTGGTAQITKAAEACSKLAPMYRRPRAKQGPSLWRGQASPRPQYGLGRLTGRGG